MIYFIYDILLLIASVAYLPFYALRGRVHKRIFSRLGFLSPDIQASDGEGKSAIWIHAVSVGEARAVESLVRLIRGRWPRERIVVSTVTPTGYAILRKFLKKDELAFFAPLDISWVVAKFIRALRPRLLLVMETELWPNLLRLNAAAGTRIILVNGRISDRSFQGYRNLSWFFGPALRKVDLFCMQSEESARRIRRLAIPQDRIRVTGNIKFDLQDDFIEPAFFPKFKDLIGGQILWVCGSTHDNEEEAVLALYKSLRKDFTNLRLVIAPRHLERLDKIRRLIRVNGLEAAFLSKLNSFSSAQVALLDTMGDLSAVYSLADVVFIGGSLVKKGGHNPIEPAVFGKPVLFGPFMDNFREIRDIFIKEKAAIEVEHSQGLEYEMRRLLASPAERKALGERGRQILSGHRGATERTISEIARKAGL
ncbi:MAG: 3-deoxy-D-manno-octulosonic acid transferase [Candidatus Omnitrophota bacterium]